MSILSDTIANGGGTFNADGSPFTGTGFVVGIKDGTWAKVSVDAPGHFMAAVIALSLEIKDGEWYPETRIGTWVHDGEIHIDPVLVIDDRDAAEVIGRTFNQIAIFDLGNMEEITL